MPETAIQVISLHDKKNAVLGFDLKEILEALDGHLAKWQWCITDLDCLGREGESVSHMVQAAGGTGVWMSSERLAVLAQEIQQTIEGTFLAFPRSIDKQGVLPLELNLGRFPSSRAELAIVAVDSTCFEVYAKDPEILDLLRPQFQDVRDEDPGLYFSS